MSIQKMNTMELDNLVDDWMRKSERGGLEVSSAKTPELVDQQAEIVFRLRRAGAAFTISQRDGGGVILRISSRREWRR